MEAVGGGAVASRRGGVAGSRGRVSQLGATVSKYPDQGWAHRHWWPTAPEAAGPCAVGSGEGRPPLGSYRGLPRQGGLREPEGGLRQPGSCKGMNPIVGPCCDGLTSQRPLLLASGWGLGLST